MKTKSNFVSPCNLLIVIALALAIGAGISWLIAGTVTIESKVLLYFALAAIAGRFFLFLLVKKEKKSSGYSRSD